MNSFMNIEVPSVPSNAKSTTAPCGVASCETTTSSTSVPTSSTATTNKDVTGTQPAKECNRQGNRSHYPGTPASPSYDRIRSRTNDSSLQQPRKHKRRRIAAASKTCGAASQKMLSPNTKMGDAENSDELCSKNDDDRAGRKRSSCGSQHVSGSASGDELSSGLPTFRSSNIADGTCDHEDSLVQPNNYLDADKADTAAAADGGPKNSESKPPSPTGGGTMQVGTVVYCLWPPNGVSLYHIKRYGSPRPHRSTFFGV